MCKNRSPRSCTSLIRPIKRIKLNLNAKITAHLILCCTFAHLISIQDRTRQDKTRDE
uniref:Uncharacterized protein n=1 Tax=Rhizophora mucronata TaxID=61149 RepID=A0A2P2PVK3_RHIMU